MSFIESPARRTLVFYVCFLLGVSIASYWWLSRAHLSYLLFIFAVSIPFVTATSGRIRFCIIAFLITLLGISRVLFVFPANVSSEISYWNGKEIVLHAVINDEIKIGAFAQQIRANVNEIIFENGTHFIKGNVRIEIDKENRVAYGDAIEVKCTLRAPRPNNDIAYDRILAKEGVYSECAGVRPVSVLLHSQGNQVYQSLFLLKSRVSTLMHSLFRQPHASFLAGILYGDREMIPKNLVQDFQTSGMSHILAISGYNITIVVGMLSALFLNLRIPRKRAIIALLFSVVAFVVFVGGGGAVVRAALMGLVPSGARLISRRTNPLYLLVLVAVLMILWNPLILLYDAGFALSVTATWGMIALSPILVPLFKRVPGFVAEPLVTSLSAIVATTPLIAYLFGRVSVVGTLANVLVLPAVPSLMAMSALALSFAMISLSVAKWIASIAFLISSYCLAIIHFAAGLGWASFDVSWFGFIPMVLCYAVLLWMVYGTDFHFKTKSSQIVTIDKETWYIDEYE